MKRLLTTEEVAEQWGIKPETLHRMRYNGTAPPAFKIGRVLRWDPDELDEWLRKQR